MSRICFLNVINVEAELNNKQITIKDKAIIVEVVGEEAECIIKEEQNCCGRWQQQKATYSWGKER